MRSRRRNTYKLILFVLLVSISLGYAFIQTDLSIIGTGKIAATSWDIHFNNVQVTTGSVSLSTGDSAATINQTDNTLVEYTITLSNPGDFYEFTVDVVNSGSLNGMIDSISSKMNGTTITTLPSYMNYSVTYSNDMPIKEKHLLASNQTDTYKVRVEYKTDIDPSDLPDTLQTNTFSFGVTYVQADNTAVTRPTQPIIKATSSSDTTAFRSNTYRNNIKTITLGEEINVPDNAVASWDISADSSGNVMAYVMTNEDDNTKYDLYIQGDGKLYANPVSSYLFYNLSYLDVVNNMSALDTSNVTDMSYMFYRTGFSSTVFTLDLGDNFDTSNVTNMDSMFNTVGYNSTIFTLDLGDKFDTSKVENMIRMFYDTGRNSSVFTLNLGGKFDTSNVTTMQEMFYQVGRNAPNFHLDLGSKFDTSKVENMAFMFRCTGYSSTGFTLNLGSNFDTSNVTNMYGMFESAGSGSLVFTLDLGDKFDTSNVTNMRRMFYQTGDRCSIFTLNFGSKFSTSNVTTMQEMFYKTGYYNNSLELDLSTFDFSNVTNYTDIFYLMKSTSKIWVGNSTAQNWIITNSGNSNLTSANVLIKS